ncbi:MAG: FIST C-terminal domain-containing protein [Clostridiales Family XIII bacterium]|jgi:hypothetical protein|nr:FIST C-terminal domain-containing protein [Clostridiales Family XIII bacterium]
MIKMMTAYTLEVDDEQLALEEILEQLKLEETQLKHSVGILSCHSDFVDTGVAQYISDHIPFDVVGCTTIGNSVTGESDMFMLCIAMLTSDDVEFSAGWAPALEEDPAAALKTAVDGARLPQGGKPALAIPFLPTSKTVSSESVMDALSEAISGAPVFGTVACDSTADSIYSHTLCNGEASRDSLALLLLWGDVDPAFFVAHISKDRAQKYKGIITKADGSLLQEINDMPTEDYMASIGIEMKKEIMAGSVMPLIIDSHDGSQPIALGPYTVTDEGALVCGGRVPVDATLAVGTLEADDILQTTEAIIREILATGKRGGLLMFPCISRFVTMGNELTTEMDIVKNAVGESVPYLLNYGLGELCPVYDSTGKVVNKFHNFSFTACVF